MRNYSPNRVPGRCYFFTVRLADPRSTLLTDQVVAFGAALRQVRTKLPFHLDAWVVLHDHAHTIWTLPPGEHDCAGRWRAVKIAFSKAVRSAGPAPALWQHRFLHHALASDDDYRRLVDYVHANPVRHGMCARDADWPWSSVHRFRLQGMLE